MSRLKNLSPIDFEELCRDIAHAETGLRFSAFGPGPDGGIDGRHSKGDHATILQCKHFLRSSFADLKRAITAELAKLAVLQPSRYILFTSHSLSPSRSDALGALLRGYLKNSGDIWGLEDIEGSLRRHPDIEKSHLKLWLSSTAVLERILQSGLEAYTQATRETIVRELKVYVRNDSFDQAAKKLEDLKILIISGAPGVGKTTLARMLSYYYINDGWHFCAIRTLEEGFSRIDDQAPTIFYFDDFLGRIKLDRQSLLQRESALATFVQRVRESKNARFVLTTRAHIFEEARQISDYVDDRRLQLSKYLLDVGSYTRKIKAYILFNHLSASSLTSEHFAALQEGDWLKKIIDHRNYNPRVIASASSGCLDDVDPATYPSYLYNALENPDLIWSKPFRALDIKSQNLIVSLFFSSEFGEEIERLQDNFFHLHRVVCAHYGQPTMPSDFEDALKSLESGFLSISGQRVSFVNPSLRDFIKSYLIERRFLMLLPTAARRTDWAGRLWQHAKGVFKSRSAEKKEFALKWQKFAGRIDVIPSLERAKNKNWWPVSANDLPISDRVNLLLEWWEASANEFYLERAVEILNAGSVEVVAQQDGQTFPEIHWWIRNFIDDDHPLKEPLLNAVVEQLLVALEGSFSADELVSVVNSVREFMSHDSPVSVEEALDLLIRYELFDTSSAIVHFDDAQSLSEHLEYIVRLAQITGYEAKEARKTIISRLAEFEENTDEEYKSSFVGSEHRAPERFSDEAIKSLFANLTHF